MSDVQKGLVNYVRSILTPFLIIPCHTFDKEVSKIAYLEKQHSWFQTLSCCLLKANPIAWIIPFWILLAIILLSIHKAMKYKGSFPYFSP